MTGRPSSYDPAYCEKVIELGKQGASVVEMAFEIGVSRNTLETNWPAQHPEFLEALTCAREASQAWWEKTGRTNLVTSGFQSAMWSRSMAARFPDDWRDTSRRELTGKDGDPIKTQELNDDAAAFRRRLLSSAPDSAAEGGNGEAERGSAG